MTRPIWAVGLLALLAGTLLWFRLRDSPSPANHDPGHAIPSAPAPAQALSREARQKLLADIPEAHLADGLNLSSNTIQQDLAIVGAVFAAYRSIYPGKGNPIGDNREISDTLRGANPNGIPFLPAGHRAINQRGELCDRWGTPLFFHAESGIKMEIRSAGPDQKPWTADDVTIVP